MAERHTPASRVSVIVGKTLATNGCALRLFAGFLAEEPRR
jgi:hypothetical protein